MVENSSRFIVHLVSRNDRIIEWSTGIKTLIRNYKSMFCFEFGRLLLLKKWLGIEQKNWLGE